MIFSDFFALASKPEPSDKEVEVDTAGVQQLVGRTIVTAFREPPSEERFPYYDETLTLTLDDGSVWRFEGEGYDASRLVMYVQKPVKATELQRENP